MGLVAEIRKIIDTRAGRKQAEREISFVASGYFSPQQMADAPIEWQKKARGDNPYAHGRAHRWYEEGYRDAEAGRSRSLKFENSSYDCGWIEGMRGRHKQGFRHESLAREFERLVRLHIHKDLWPTFGIN